MLEQCVEFDERDVSRSTYQMVQLTDRGSLKWPSLPVIDVAITLWSLHLNIENYPETFTTFIKSPSR